MRPVSCLVSLLSLYSPTCCLLTSSFFFNDTAPTEIYTLSLHDALPISIPARRCSMSGYPSKESRIREGRNENVCAIPRSEEHTSELQSRQYLVCRLLLEKKKRR